MNDKNKKSNNNKLKTPIINPIISKEIVSAIQILNETSGINTQGHIDKTISKLGIIIQADSKDKFEYLTLSDLRSSDNVTKPIKFFGSINRISDTYPLSFVGSSTVFDAINVEIVDNRGQIINAIPIISNEMKQKIQSFDNDYSAMCFYGTVLYGLKVRDKANASDKSNLEYKFFITDVEQADDSYEASSIAKQENVRRLMSDKDLQDELMVALNILDKTEKYHEEGYYDKIRPQVGLTFVKIPRERYVYKESLINVLKKDDVLKPVKFYGTISSISNPKVLSIKRDTGAIVSFDAIDLELKDLKNNTVKTIPIVSDKKKKIISDFVERYSRFCFYGLVSYGLIKRRRTNTSKINIDDLEYRFIINEIEPAENLLEINNFSETEIANARGLIEKLSTKKNDIMKYIFSKASKGLGIKGLDHSPLLKVSLEFLVLQSLSDYTAGNRSAKLHSMIVGPPAVGKGKLSEAVRVLNPLFREASIAKPTPAGFIGTSKSEGGKWKSEPGLFPLAHRGVLIIQDFHELKSKHETFNIFSKVMEDGVVIDSSSSRATHLALTALHLDTNKLADVYFDDSDRIQKSRYKKLKKIGIPLQILSRFDFIADFARDTAIQNMIARKMLNSDGSSKSLIGDLVFEPWVRELQAIVAILRTDFIDIIFTPVIKKYMQEKYDELTKEIGPGDDYISDFLPRMSQSFIKIVTATCRGNARKEASKEDVDYAYRFVKLKLDFLMAVKPERVGNDGKSSTTISPALLINIKYEGETITLPMAREYVNSHIDNPVSERQIRRYLEGISEKAGRGKWKINKLTF